MMLMVVAIACGLAASYMTSRLLADRAAHQNDDTKVTVVVAKQRVSAWQQIKEPEKYFGLKEIPEMAAPKKALKTLEELKDQRLSKPLGEDEYVTQDHLVNKEMAGLEIALPKGTKAMAIKVNQESLVGGFVRPASRVDILYASRGGSGEAYSQILLQDMLVLAVDTTSTRDPQTQTIIGSTVTLAVKPEEGERLALAQTQGELRLMLRGLGDTDRPQVAPAKINDLTRPFHGDLATNNDDTQVTSATQPPVVLPPVLPPAPPVDQPAPRKEDPAPETHTMLIYNGEYLQRAVFVKNDDGSWKVAPSSDDPPPLLRRRTDPTPVPAPGKNDRPAADSAGRPESPQLPFVGKSGP
jgi:pilus assembly protein CpaB